MDLIEFFRDKIDTSKIWATGAISKSFRKLPINILGKHEIKELVSTTILGNAHPFRKVLI